MNSRRFMGISVEDRTLLHCIGTVHHRKSFVEMSEMGVRFGRYNAAHDVSRPFGCAPDSRPVRRPEIAVGEVPFRNYSPTLAASTLAGSRPPNSLQTAACPPSGMRRSVRQRIGQA